MSKTPTRVLQVHHFRYPMVAGGVDRVVAELVRELGPSQVVLFEVGEWADARLRRREEEGLTVYRRRLRAPGDAHGLARRLMAGLEFLTILLQLAWIVRRERIHVVQLHTLQDYHRYFVVLARLGLCKYLVTLHGSETLAFPERPEAQRRRWADVLRQATVVTAVSRTLSAIALERLPLAQMPTTVHNGISEPGPTASSVGCPWPRPYAICVGALRHYKGHDVAIEVWRHLDAAGGGSLDLLIVGRGELETELKAQAQALEGKVHFLGSLKHGSVLALVDAATLYLMPSRSEGLSIALLEAAALQKAIVATDLPTFREVVEHDCSGRLFPPEDSATLAAQVQDLAADGPMRERLGESARARYEEQFTVERMASGYRKLYAAIAEGRVVERDSSVSGDPSDLR